MGHSINRSWLAYWLPIGIMVNRNPWKPNNRAMQQGHWSGPWETGWCIIDYREELWQPRDSCEGLIHSIWSHFSDSSSHGPYSIKILSVVYANASKISKSSTELYCEYSELSYMVPISTEMTYRQIKMNISKVQFIIMSWPFLLYFLTPVRNLSTVFNTHHIQSVTKTWPSITKQFL